jgi:beta-glucanase (GH16 family)
MLPIRKKIVATLCALTATAAAAATVPIASPASSAAQKQAVSISIVPGVIGPGKGLQTSSSAKWAVTAKFGANKAGKKVLLQRLSGTSWVAALNGVIDDDGTVVFPVSASVTGVPVSYRVYGAGVASAPVSTDRWGSDTDFADEFAGTKLSGSWENRQQLYQPDALRKCSKGSSKTVKVGRGTAQLSVVVDKSKGNKLCTAKRANGKAIGKFKYRLNANISTMSSHRMKYGVMAARIKFQPLQGQHASLWMQPAQPSSAKNAKQAGTEIDIIEWFGKDVPNGGLTSFVYAPTQSGPKKIGGWIKNPERFLSSPKDDWFKSYHVFSVEWTPSAYIFRIDGQETRRITTGVSGIAEYPILSLLSSDYELAKLEDEKSLPQTMQVDWVKMWQDPTQVD